MNVCEHCNFYKYGECQKEANGEFVDIRRCEDEYNDYMIDYYESRD